ncbi:hypothetical protein N7U49_22315 [Streptomyces sp. AD2-2]|nr:hypothetical protein N7U49_22315 [Streptomyces sp. AD2-2]
MDSPAFAAARWATVRKPSMPVWIVHVFSGSSGLSAAFQLVRPIM